MGDRPLDCEKHADGVWDVSFPAGIPAKIVFRGSAADPRGLPPIAADVLEVATGLLWVDRRVHRPLSGLRRIRAELPVRDPERWTRVSESLGSLLSFLTYDDIACTFRQLEAGEELVSAEGDLRPPAAEAPDVSLFSGGLDSTAGTASLLAEGRRLMLVSHYTRRFEHLQSLVADLVDEYGSDGAASWNGFYVIPDGKKLVGSLREASRRSRSFFFLSMALLTALMSGSRRILACENGPLALNLPLNLASVPTRHAHGRHLASVAELFEALIDSPLSVQNPFELKTKGEMTRIFAHRPELALRTVSCWNQQWAGSGTTYGAGHCGRCVPCLVRLASLVAARIDIPPSHFDVDLRTAGQQGLDSNEAADLHQLLHFASRIRACASWREFIIEFPEVMESEPTLDRDMPTEEWFDAVFEMETRFAEEIVTAFRVV